MESQNKNILVFPNLDYDPDSRGLGYALYECLQKNKEELAQIYGPTGQKDTFGQVLERSVRTASAMKKMGIKPGDYVSLCTFNHLNSCTPVLASFFLGAIVASVDPTLSLEETKQFLQQIPPKIIFVQTDAVEMIENVIKILNLNVIVVVFGETTKYINFFDFLKSNHEEISFKPVEAKSVKDIAIIFFSSGSTGLPKGVCVNHYSLIGGCVNLLKCGLDFQLHLAYASPYWTVFITILISSIISGLARLVYPKFDPENSWDLFKYKLTTVFLNATQAITMLNKGRPKNVDTSSVQDILVIGENLTLEQILQVKAMFHGIRVHFMYGLSEVCGPVLAFQVNSKTHLELLGKKVSSCGSGFQGISYKIVNPDSEEVLGPLQHGELRVKTELELNGYHNIDSSDIWDSEGWLKTGDVAYYDEDRCFYIVDRIKQMFKYQCWHVVPAVLENVLLTNPAVEEAIVIGVPHEIDGNHPMAIVKLKAQVTCQEIEKYVEERVSNRQKLRAGVKIVDRFPITASGKINRTALKKMVLDGKI